MSSNVDTKLNQIVEKLIKVEGGYVNNPLDSGGETNWGITVAVARANGYQGQMSLMTRNTALQIYKQEYIIQPRFFDIYQISEKIGYELIDSGVNAGVTLASKWLQRTLNAANRRQKLYEDLTVDGNIGPKTIACLQKLLHHRTDGVPFVLCCLNVLQGAHYFEITEKGEKNEEFFYGWIMNRVIEWT